MRQVDLRSQFVRQAIGQKVVDRNCVERGVGEQGVARGVGEARRLDLDMEIVDVERIGLRLEAREDVEDRQRDDRPARSAGIRRSSVRGTRS